MEQKLSLQMSQKLSLSVQMQQAVKILQLSASDLQTVIEKEFLENPALEYEESGETERRYTFEDLRSMRCFLREGAKAGRDRVQNEEKPSFEATAARKPTLEQILTSQVNVAFARGKERDIAAYIVGLIDEHGYLRGSVEEIARRYAAATDEVEAVLQIVQGFEPDGVGARNLRECLLIQSRQLGICRGIVRAIIEEHLELIAAGKFKKIAALTGAPLPEVQRAVDAIRALHPKPGLVYASAVASYIAPDVLIQRDGENFTVSVSDCGLPRLHISPLCDGRYLDGDARSYIEERVNAAVWLLKSIEQRRQTLRRVTEEIVRTQQEYFRRGEGFLRPLLMKEVATRTGLHESTVSRAVANKYAATPFGIRSLKSFFNANLAADGEELVAAQVKARLRSFIAAENGQKPLSDQKLASLLQKEHMHISRRTVMKYREQLGIASSLKRKQY